MRPFYRLRRRLGLADLAGKRAAAHPPQTPLDLAIARLRTARTVGQPAGDDALSARIVDAYCQASEAFPGYGDSMWTWINRLAQPTHELLVSGDAAALTEALDNPHTTNLFQGFDNPVAASFGFQAEDRNLLSNEIGPGFESRIYHAIKRLAEATGAVKIANPETATGTALDPDDYLDLIDAKLGVALEFPNFYAQEQGIVTRRGIISFRPLQAIYQAVRLHQLGARRVLEIGAGLGRTAFYAHKLGIAEYTIVDIPLSNVAQAHFLGRALGSAVIALFGESGCPIRITGPRFVENCSERFDIVLNVDSLSEMDRGVAAGYVDFARAAADRLLSINREWDGAPRVSDLLGATPTTRFPYWMRDGYVEELATFG